MFGRKGHSERDAAEGSVVSLDIPDRAAASEPAAAAPISIAPIPGKGPAMSQTTVKPPAPLSPANRRFDLPATPRRPTEGMVPTPPASLAAAAAEQRKLVVGRDIVLAGEINACEQLIVEGTVEARLREGRSIEISETGLFKGSVEIEEADIAGRFEGDLTVRGRLKVRATGRITGAVVYGELEVEAGGQIVGELKRGEA
ncbi:MAG TPA: polymer-forming cytoskeletal protein [Alphaproteobacteria bacterium]|nr:polymer-forming cytoskeletal protein [Alphaproteobacteria bacterium]